GATLSNNAPASAPLACTGGTVTVTWTATSTCQTATTSATFTVTAAPVLTITSASNQSQNGCQTQAAINTAYTAWLASVTMSGGCAGATLSNNAPASAPLACTGGTVTVTWTATSTCQTATTSATFTVTAAPVLTITSASNQSQNGCSTQAAINTAYT